MKSMTVSVALLRHRKRLAREGAEEAIENEVARKVRASRRMGNEVLRQRSIASANEMKQPACCQLLTVLQDLMLPPFSSYTLNCFLSTMATTRSGNATITNL